MPPSGEYFTAFSSKLCSTCRIRLGSARANRSAGTAASKLCSGEWPATGLIASTTSFATGSAW